MSNFGANKARVDHEGDLFEVANQVAPILDGLFADLGTLVVNEGQNLLKRLLFQKTSAHLNELVCSLSVILACVLEETLPERDKGNAPGNDDRKVFEQSNIHLRLL